MLTCLLWKNINWKKRQLVQKWATDEKKSQGGIQNQVTRTRDVSGACVQDCRMASVWMRQKGPFRELIKQVENLLPFDWLGKIGWFHELKMWAAAFGWKAEMKGTQVNVLTGRPQPRDCLPAQQVLPTRMDRWAWRNQLGWSEDNLPGFAKEKAVWKTENRQHRCWDKTEAK